MINIEKLINQVFFFMFGLIFMLFILSGILYLMIDDLAKKLGDWCS